MAQQLDERGPADGWAAAVTAEQHAAAGDGVRLCWQAFGDRSDPPLLLVGGLGQQLVAWPDGLCAALAAAGFYVVRFDNRDVGRSTRLDAVAPPTTPRLLAGRFVREQYDLGAMARDTAGLLDALGLGPAHVVGVSMGGMIGQTLAARHPASVRSLVSAMSRTGARRAGRPAPSTLRLLLRPPARERAEVVERAVAMFRHIGSAGYPFDERLVRELAGRSYDRGHDPAGVARQLAAIVGSGDRTAELRGVRAPTLVLHGDRDRMVHPTGGRATASAIPGARLVTLPGMGHDLPAGVWGRLTELIAGHARAADAAGAGTAA